jgi:signal transduction histidine kinase
VLLGLWCATLLTIIVARRGARRLAGYTFGIIGIGSVVAGAVAHGNPGFASFFLIVGVLLSAMVLPPRDVAIVAVIGLLGEGLIATLPSSASHLFTLASVYAEGTLLLVIASAVVIAMSASIRDMVRDLEHTLAVARAATSEAASLAAQLEHSQRMEVVGRLAGGVAHDFNNLLTIIRAASATAAEQLPEDSTVRADLEDVDNAVIRAAALSRQLLDFIRKDSGDVRVVDLADLTRGLEELLRRAASPSTCAPPTSPVRCWRRPRRWSRCC